ncbi:hypothetical protein R69749_03674 [Paraburkholderia domus]|nr:hypothetical protein R69749_03674 [Paraburkholderia domus]
MGPHVGDLTVGLTLRAGNGGIMRAPRLLAQGGYLALVLAEISLGVLVNIGAREQLRRREPEIFAVLVKSTD